MRLPRPLRRSYPDPYEQAAGRLDAQRRADAAGDVAAPPRDVPLPPRPPLKWILIIFGVVVLVVILRGLQTNRPPSLTANCHRFAVKLSATSVSKNAVIRYTVAGPSTARVQLVVDVNGFGKGPHGSYLPHPLPGLTTGRTEEASHPIHLSGCRQSGAFRVIVPPGHHTVFVLQLLPDGTGRPVATATFVNRSS